MKMYTFAKHNTGKPIETDSEKKAYAKEVDNKLYIRLDVNSKLYDPQGLVAPTGRDKYSVPLKYLKVDQDTFDTYLLYLQNKKTGTLELARRKASING